MARYKTTPLARFLIFMVVAAPLLYLLSTYITGEEVNLEWPWAKEESAIEVADAEEAKEADSKDLVSKDSLAADTALEKSLSGNLDSIEENEPKTMSLRDSLELLQMQLDSCRKN